VSVTLVLTQLLQYRRDEVGVMEAKNYYLTLLQGKDGKWYLPLDERLSKGEKSTGEIMFQKNFIAISQRKRILFSACAKCLYLRIKLASREGQAIKGCSLFPKTTRHHKSLLRAPPEDTTNDTEHLQPGTSAVALSGNDQ
jgi:hypothetical protein